MKNRYLKCLAVILLLLGHVHLNAQTLPTGISNLRLWLDASDVNNGTANPADGSNITTWKDKSGNSNDATVLSGQSAGKVYANQISGQPVVRFTKASQFLGSVYQVPGVDIRATTSSSVTIFTVYKQGAHNGLLGLWGNDNGDWDRFFMSSFTPYGADNGLASLGPTYSGANVTGAGIVGVTRLLTAVYSHNVTNGSAIYFNGQTVTTFTDQTNLTAAQTSLRIGWDGDDNCYNGDIAEMIVYNRQLTACEIQQVNRYLGAKYGIVFSTVGINTPGSVTAFPEGGSLALTSSVTGTAYQWLLNGNAISGATSSSYTAATPGDYRVAVTNGCIDTSAVKAITVATMTTPGNALNLDGSNDYVDCGTNASLAATNIKTMEAWVRFSNTSTDQEILSKSISGSGIELLLYNNTLSFYCMNGTNTSYVSYPSSNFTTGIWYHLAAAWDGTTKESMRLYVNGVSVGTRTDAGNINTSGITNPAGSFKIGRWSETVNPRYFNGSIDEVRVWSAQRTQTDIQTNMLNIVSPASGLVAYYKFDLGTAGSANAGVTSVYDVSGNSQSGTLSGFTLSGSGSNWVESYAMVVPAPVAATNINTSGFMANWTAAPVGTVSNYSLDVSTNSTFSSFVTGYNGLNAGAGTSQAVTGLAPTTTYYYRVRANKSSVNGQGSYLGTFTTATTLAVLPVALVDFSVRQQAGHVLLEWSTASELNSAHFNIERSSNGTDFTRIATVQAAGNSSMKLRYASNDRAPKNGVNFYRLRQLDKDGKSTYSAVQQVIFVEGKAYVLVYPSPATDLITIESNDAGLAGTTGIISDMHGRVVRKFLINNTKQQVNVSTLAKGIYHVQLADKQIFRIVKE